MVPGVQRLSEMWIETASPSAVERSQWSALRDFLSGCVARSPFHQRRIAAAGLDPARISSLDDFRRLPLLTKEDVVEDIAEYPPFGSNLSTQPHETVHYVETSGTSQKGVERYLLNADDESALARLEAFGFRWAGCEKGKLVATTLPLTTKAAGRWHHLGVRLLGGVYVPLGNYNAEQKMEYLTRLPIHTLVATPSYLRRLEIEAERGGTSLQSLGIEALMISGEPFTVDWVRERERRWDANVYEQYGTTQRAFAWSCEQGAVNRGRRGVLHTIPHLAFYEVLDSVSGQPVAAGDFGELVITPFSCSNVGPLVRFSTGDRVRWLEPESCVCGRPFPGIEAGSVQRLDASLKVKGVNLYTEELDPLILRDPVVDYEGVVRLDDHGRERVIVQVELRQDARNPQDCMEDLRVRLSKLTGVRIDIERHQGHLATNDMSTDMRKRLRWRDLRQEEQ